MEEESLDKRYVYSTVSIITAFMFILSSLAAISSAMLGSAFLLLYFGGLVSVAVFTRNAGYTNINKRTRKYASRLSYLGIVLSLYWYGILLFFVETNWQPFIAPVNTVYFVIFMAYITIVSSILVPILVLVNRLFIKVGVNFRVDVPEEDMNIGSGGPKICLQCKFSNLSTSSQCANCGFLFQH